MIQAMSKNGALCPGINCMYVCDIDLVDISLPSYADISDVAVHDMSVQKCHRVMMIWKPSTQAPQEPAMPAR
jgi:hypothetical protein